MKTGQKHLLLFTIAEYRHHPTIIGAGADADHLRTVLTDEYGFGSVVELRNAQATNAAIREALRALRRLPPEDDVAIYFNGHGHTDEDGIGFWLPWDAGEHIETGTNLIQLQRVRNYLTAIRCRHVLLLANCCFAGDLLEQSRDLAVQRPPDYREQARRFASREVLTAGGSEPVPAGGMGRESPFGWHLCRTLETIDQAWLDAQDLFAHIKRGLSGHVPRYGALKACGHEGGALILERQRRFTVTSQPVPPPAPTEPPLPVGTASGQPGAATSASDGSQAPKTTWETTACAACGKTLATRIDVVGQCYTAGCGAPICNLCWTTLHRRHCREHFVREKCYCKKLARGKIIGLFFLLLLVCMIGLTFLKIGKQTDTESAALKRFSEKTGIVIPPYIARIADLAEQGDVLSAQFISRWIADGGSFFIRDLMADDFNDTPSANYLMGMAWLYEGQPHDVPAAVGFLEKAGLQGSTHALYEMGKLYEDGAGPVQPDPRLAYRYFNKAAENGCHDAWIHLEKIYGK